MAGSADPEAVRAPCWANVAGESLAAAWLLGGKSLTSLLSDADGRPGTSGKDLAMVKVGRMMRTKWWKPNEGVSTPLISN
jgi:hypothetical protein